MSKREEILHELPTEKRNTVKNYINKLKEEKEQYESLFRFLLIEIYNVDNTEPDWNFIEQIILRKAYNLGYVELNGNEDFILSNKGKKFIKE